jgi:preprotein translocase subunit SecG
VSNLFLTLVIAFVVIVFAIALLAIGWLITGKTKIEKADGRDSTKTKDTSRHARDVCSPSNDEPKTHLEDHPLSPSKG